VTVKIGPPLVRICPSANLPICPSAQLCLFGVMHASLLAHRLASSPSSAHVRLAHQPPPIETSAAPPSRTSVVRYDDPKKAIVSWL